MFNKIAKLFHREKQERHLNAGTAFLNLYKILWHDGTPLVDSMIISRRITADYDDWNEDKKKEFWTEIEKDKQEYFNRKKSEIK